MQTKTANFYLRNYAIRFITVYLKVQLFIIKKPNLRPKKQLPVDDLITGTVAWIYDGRRLIAIHRKTRLNVDGFKSSRLTSDPAR